MTQHDLPATPRRRRRRIRGAVLACCLGIVLASALAVVHARSRTAAGPAAAAPAGTDAAPVAADVPASGLARRLYVDPGSQAAAWVRAHPTGPASRLVRTRIADQPTGKWFGAWSGDITPAVSQYVTAASAAHKVPLLVAYNLPQRDCGGQSAGGLTTPQEYDRWIAGFAAGIAHRPAMVILEPDALAQLDGCLSPDQQRARLGMLRHAVDVLQSRNVAVYLDAGHANWVPAGDIATRLRQAGVAHAQGFALNVSNFDATNVETDYGRQVNAALGLSKQFVVDTSRNGNGDAGGQWCNPAGRKLGTPPQAGGSGELFLWVKAPGESDGDCGVGAGTTAGQFVPQLALDLIRGR